MTTKKLLAKEVIVTYPHPQNKYYQVIDRSRCYFLAEDGSRYVFERVNDLQIGDKSFIVKRLNVPNHSMYWQYEIYPITIEKDSQYNRVKLWFSKSRYLVRKLS